MFVGPSVALSQHTPINILPLYGIQSASFDFGEPLTDMESAEGVYERLHLNPNEVNLRFSYHVRDGTNEENMGLMIDGTGSAFAYLWNYERNYFLATRNDGRDILIYSGYDTTVFAFGQGCITSYGVRATVGEPLMANVSLSFLNVGVSLSGLDVQLPVVHKTDGTTVYTYGFDNNFYTGSGDSVDYTSSVSDLFTGSGTNNAETDNSSYFATGTGWTTDWQALDTTYTLPSVYFDNAPLYAIGPGDITLHIPNDATFSDIISGEDACVIQSFDLQAALIHFDDRPMGYVYPRNRLVDPPIEVRFNVNAFVDRSKAALLNERLCMNSGQAIEISVRNRCNNSTEIIKYRLEGARLTNTSTELSIGNIMQVSYNWSAQIFEQNETGVTLANLLITANP